MKKMPFIFAIITVTVVFAAPLTAFAAISVPQKILDLRPSVVRVVADNGSGAYAMGTGFPLGTGEPVEYIATNNHVVAQNTGFLKVWYGSRTIINATVAVQKPDSDLCVLKLETPIYGMAPLALNDRGDAKTGDPIYALGFPGSADTFSNNVTANADEVTVTEGIISSIKSASITQNGNAIKLYQIDAAINPGNSGGPLFNENGEVIGINSYGAQNAQNINAAISIDELISLIKQQDIPFTMGVASAGNQQTAAGNTARPLNTAVIIIFAVGAGVVVLAVVLLVTNNRRKYIPLEVWLENAGGRVPFEKALLVLEPVIKTLAGMHVRGTSHLDICPDRIAVNKRTQRGVLLPPGEIEKIGCNVLTRPGYSPIEQYKSKGDIGPWSDVYSMGAVLYWMVNGAVPPDAITRMDDDKELQRDIRSRMIDEKLKHTWLRALSMQAGERIPDCGKLAAEFYATYVR